MRNDQTASFGPHHGEHERHANCHKLDPPCIPVEKPSPWSSDADHGYDKFAQREAVVQTIDTQLEVGKRGYAALMQNIDRVPDKYMRHAAADKLDLLLQSKKELSTPDEAAEILCSLQAIVSRAHGNEVPNECFCKQPNEGWRSSGDAIRFIAKATFAGLETKQ